MTELQIRFQSVLDSMDDGDSCPDNTAECLRGAIRDVMGCPAGCPFIKPDRGEVLCEACGDAISGEEEG